MSNVTTSIRSTPSAATPTITNLVLTLSSTQYSHTFGIGTQSLLIRARGSSRLQIAFISGNTNIEFITIPKGATLPMTGLAFSGTIYIEGSVAGDVVEIMEWK